MPATEGTGLSGLGASYWSQTRDVGTPGLCQLLEQVGSKYQLLGWVSVLAASLWRSNGVCPQSKLLGGPGWLRVSVSMAGVGPKVSACVPGASCWWRVSVSICPKAAVHGEGQGGVFVCICWPSSSWTSWQVGPLDQTGVSGRPKVHPGFGGPGSMACL